MDKTQQALSPQSIPTTSFADKAQEYQELLTKQTETESDIAKTELDIQDLFRKYEWTHSGSELTGLEDKLIVFKPVVEEPKDGLVYTASRAEGRAFSEIVSNPPLMKRLEKKFGKEFSKFFRDVDDVFHYKEIKPNPERDVEKTDAFKADYRKLSDKLIRLRVDLKTVKQNIQNVRDYIAFCKELGTLAGPQKGGKDQNQQKGGGNN